MVRARLRQQRADEANKHSSNSDCQIAVNHRIEGDEECIYGEVKSATIEDFAGPAEGLALVHRPLLRKTGEVEEYKQEPSDPTESKPKLRKRKAGKNKSRTRKAWKPLDCDESPCSASTTTTTTATPETAFVPLGIEQCRGAAHRMWDIELPQMTLGISSGGAPGPLCPLGGISRRSASPARKSLGKR